MAEDNKNIFRQKSLETISSPEQLTSYLRVTNPRIWVLLVAVILLLGGLFAWSMVGKIETTQEATAFVENGQAKITVMESGKKKPEAGMIVRFGSDEYKISTVDVDEYGKVTAYVPVSVPDGKYDVKIVMESIHPIKFLFS
ncbi:hypothetical protein SAMN04487934_103120 [Eubacterium ruminantium]|nr:hypothetical protein SAMN04487934_103120 [Eubacterium ruminantium]